MAMGSVRFSDLTFPREYTLSKVSSWWQAPFQVMVMKMHSYLTVNGHLRHVSEQSRLLFRRLQEATVNFGGMEQALKDAVIPECSRMSEGNSVDTTRSGTPEVPEGSSATYIDPASAVILRKRLNAMAAELDSNNPIQCVEEKARGTNFSTTLSSISDMKERTQPQQHPLVSHPDPVISALARDYSDLQMELVSRESGLVTWPQNISWKNFAEYQLIPTLVYELEYPRTNKYVMLSRSINEVSDLDAEFDLFMSLKKLSAGYISVGLHWNNVHLGGNLRHICPAIYRHRGFHLTTDPNFRSIFFQIFAWSLSSFHDRLYPAFLYHLRWVGSSWDVVVATSIILFQNAFVMDLPNYHSGWWWYSPRVSLLD